MGGLHLDFRLYKFHVSNHMILNKLLIVSIAIYIHAIL